MLPGRYRRVVEAATPRGQARREASARSRPRPRVSSCPPPPACLMAPLLGGTHHTSPAARHHRYWGKLIGRVTTLARLAGGPKNSGDDLGLPERTVSWSPGI